MKQTKPSILELRSLSLVLDGQSRVHRMVRQKTRRMPRQVAERVALEFVARINQGDADGLSELMSVDHRLVDSLGSQVAGRSVVREAWIQYFKMVPGYRLAIQTTLTNGPTVVLLGTAGGGYIPSGRRVSVGRWRTPAAWRALVRRGLVTEWQVFADNEPIRALARRGSRSPRWTPKTGH